MDPDPNFCQIWSDSRLLSAVLRIRIRIHGSTCFWASWILSQRYGSGSCSGSGSEFLLNLIRQSAFVSSVADPNPDPPDPYVIGPPGSGAISQRYGSGSEFLWNLIRQSAFVSSVAEPNPDQLLRIRILLSLSKYVIVRKTMLLFCDFFLTFYLGKMMWSTFRKLNAWKLFFKNCCLLASWRSITKIEGSGSESESGSGSISQKHGSADPNPDPRIHTEMSWIRNTVCQWTHRTYDKNVISQPGRSMLWIWNNLLQISFWGKTFCFKKKVLHLDHFVEKLVKFYQLSRVPLFYFQFILDPKLPWSGIVCLDADSDKSFGSDRIRIHNHASQWTHRISYVTSGVTGSGSGMNLR